MEIRSENHFLDSKSVANSEFFDMMKDVFLLSLRICWRQWRVASIVYFFQLCLAMTLGMQVFDVLEASIGNSLEINKLLTGYDHTVLTDFLKVHGASITPLIGQLRWLLLVWLFFSVFIDGGIIVCATSPEEKSARLFWQGGAEYFFSFLKITVFFLVLALVWTVIVWAPMFMLFEPSLQFFSSERPIIWLGIFLLFIWVFGFSILFLWSVLGRLQKIKTENSIFFSIQCAWRVLQKNRLHLICLLGGFVFVQATLVIAYFLLEAFTGMKSAILIIFLFAIQQVFIFFRIQIRQMMYIGINELTIN